MTHTEISYHLRGLGSNKTATLQPDVSAEQKRAQEKFGELHKNLEDDDKAAEKRFF